MIPRKLEGTEFVTELPKNSGRAVGMCEFKGVIILACEYAIYQLSKENVFKKIEFEVVNEKTNQK